jgi:hypothetical protein
MTGRHGENRSMIGGRLFLPNAPLEAIPLLQNLLKLSLQTISRGISDQHGAVPLLLVQPRQAASLSSSLVRVTSSALHGCS